MSTCLCLRPGVTVKVCNQYWYCRSGPDSDWGEGKSVASRRCRMYLKILPYLIPTVEQVQSRWYQEEDLMEPSREASPARRVGTCNVDGSIGGEKGHALPSKRLGW